MFSSITIDFCEKTPKIVDLNNLDIELIPDYTLIVRSITLIDFVRNNGEHLLMILELMIKENIISKINMNQHSYQ